MKDFLCIYEMLLDELANYKISEVAALGQKFQLEITETSIRSELHQLLSPIIDPLLVNIYHSKKNQGIVVGECREHRVSSFIGSFSIDELFSNYPLVEEAIKTRIFDFLELQQEIITRYIPKFHAEYSTTDLYAYGGIVCKNYFKKSPLDLICEKLLALDEETICYQKRLIAMAMQTVAINDFNKLGNECISECNDVSELKKITQEYAESIAANAICCGDSLYTYMMLFPSDDSSHFLIKYIDSALYHGGGMVMFLLSYGHYMDAAPIKALGKKMLDGFILNYIHEKQTGNFSIDDGALYSLYDGYGGLLFLCGFVVQVIEDDGYKPFYNKLLFC